ncbi:MAG: hypothetical protein ACI4S2_08205 [Lachnospiraceae bacterium]
MKEFLYAIVGYIAQVHNAILGLNDAYEYNFTDKQLHFLVIGIIGMILVFVIHPIFTWLAKHNHTLVITWIYVFTMIIVLTFAIEIGQKVSHTGAMDFADIVFGVMGFVLMFAVFAAIRGIILGIKKLLSRG